MAGLVTEYGSALVMKAKYQRIADISALAGAMGYGAQGTATALNDAVTRIANLNSIPLSDVSAAVVTSPTGDGNKAIQVTVSGTAPLELTRVLNSKSDVQISATSYAELKAAAPACVIALNGSGTGVSLNGGTALYAPNCAVESNASVSVTNGASITTTRVTYNSTTPLTQSTLNSIVAPPGKTLTIEQTPTTDLIKSVPTVVAEQYHVASLGMMTAPAAPVLPSNSNIQFGTSSTSMTSIGGGNCSATRDDYVWTVTCTGSGPFYFGSMSATSGISVNFNTSGSSTATYDFSGDINGSTGGTFRFGPGTYNVAGGIIVGSGVTMSFGAGTFNVGKLQATCAGGSGYSICDAGTSLTIAGPSAFSLAGGVYDAGGSILTLGTSTAGNTSPTANSFDVGAAADGNSLNVAGNNAVATLADASGSGDLFAMTGNITTAGGSCAVLSAAAQHDIAGSITSAGGLYLGAGNYSLGGSFSANTTGSGSISCVVNGTATSLALSGTGVTFGLGAGVTPSSGHCTGMAFCVATSLTTSLTAPTSGTTKNLLVIGPDSSTNAAGASFSGGGANTNLSGVFYVPNGPISLTGGSNATLGNGPGQCLEMVGSQVSISGGAALATACAGIGSDLGTTAQLVQ